MLANEAEFEKQVIEALTTGEISLPDLDPMDAPKQGRVFKSKLWKYEDSIKTTDDLWANFKKILEEHNQDKLDQPLSETEFAQIRREISNLGSPFKAGQFLYGQNGVSQLEVDMDDGSHKFFTVFDQREVGAGNTVYQVVNQIRKKAVLPGKKDRRFDVTLLINGLPIVQIELKTDVRAVNEALNQMHQYIEENQFTGIFSTLQVLVGMTPHSAKYMANTTGDTFNKAFAFEWKREDNTTVHDWREFTESVLSIPAAHNLSTSYMILDGTPGREGIRVMRPYQIRATEKALHAIKNLDKAERNQLGFIWHTTGSGKTITSFKTAFLASRMPYVDKVVFAVDRRALTRQTFDKYRAYDPESTGLDIASITNTSNTNELTRKLNSKDKKIIVTSVQKLHHMVKNRNFKAPDKNIVFIVDEAHRSTGSEKFFDIQKKFKRGYWLGYTGTPVFDRTEDITPTVDIFGKCLDAYTIREGIRDKNVLGFKVDFKTTIPEEEVKEKQLPEFYRVHHPEWTEEQIQEKIQNLSEKDFDDMMEPSFYDNNPKHVNAVVDDICKYWEARSVHREYNAMLTTHVGGQKRSAPMAMMYFNAFAKKNEEMIQDGKEPLKIAVTFSYDTSNGDGMLTNNKDLAKAIDYYNQEFGTSFSEMTVDEYKDDVESRLNHSSSDGKYLDLCIVVDQLLTGFDAPSLNTLYVDRTLKSRTLIQAYSRTNRIANPNTKKFGHVINYRWPKQNEEEMNKALAVYSNRDAMDYTPEERRVKNEDEGIIMPAFDTFISECKSIVEELRIKTDNFTEAPESESECVEVLKLIRQYNAKLTMAQQYTPDEVSEDFENLNPTNLEEVIPAMGLSLDQSETLVYGIANDIREKLSHKWDIPPSEIDLYVVHVKDVTVNYDYLTDLLRELMVYVHDNNQEKIDETKDRIKTFTSELDDRGYAKTIQTAVQAIEQKKFPEPNSKLKYPYTDLKNVDVIEEASKVLNTEMMINFISTWGLQNVVSPEFLWQMVTHHRYGERDFRESDISYIRKEAASRYKTYSTDPNLRSLSMIQFRNRFVDSLYKLADSVVAV